MTEFFKRSGLTRFFENTEFDQLKNKHVVILDENHDQLTRGVYSISLVPDYFQLALKTNDYSIKRIPQSNLGYAVDLIGESDIEAYLKKQFNTSKLKVIHRNIRRLEGCFKISYNLYYGNITYEKYLFLMEKLQVMIEQRFLHKSTVNKDLPQWTSLLENTYSQIIEKKASLFVISNELEPIEISLNYHHNNILFSSVSSFDTNYSKFGLGHVEIYQQLKWCLKNNYSYFEMGVGDMDYKRWWSNHIYIFSHYILYKKDSLATLLGHFEIIKIQLKEALKSMRVNDLIYGVMDLFKSNNKNKTTPISYGLKDIIEDEIGNGIKLKESDISDPQNYTLKKVLFDFLYLSQETLEDVKIYEIDEYKTYIFKGKRSAKKAERID